MRWPIALSLVASLLLPIPLVRGAGDCEAEREKLLSALEVLRSENTALRERLRRIEEILDRPRMGPHSGG